MDTARRAAGNWHTESRKSFEADTFHFTTARREGAPVGQITQIRRRAWNRHQPQTARAFMNGGAQKTARIGMERRLHEIGDRPFFVFLHFYDPHWHYDPPPQTRRIFELVALSDEFPEFLTIPAYEILAD